MNLVYMILGMIVVVAVMIDSLTILLLVLATLMFLPGCGRQVPSTSCTINGEDCHAQQDPDLQGPQGNDGHTGPQGPSAPAGRDGAAGKDGNAGKNCTVVAGVGGVTISCPDGTSEFISNGSDGVAGTDGVDGTSIAPIKFCPNDAPVYPSKFPEVGFCIDTKLYAVYSTKGGFLTEIPPGTYNSDAVGSSCTFVVLTDCRIQ